MTESDKLSRAELFNRPNEVENFRRPTCPGSTLTSASGFVVPSMATGASLVQPVIDCLSVFLGRSTG